MCSNPPNTYEGRGAVKKEEVFEPAPNIDHSNQRVALDVTHWLAWLLHDVGFDGFRFDFVKGYSGQYVKVPQTSLMILCVALKVPLHPSPPQ